MQADLWGPEGTHWDNQLTGGRGTEKQGTDRGGGRAGLIYVPPSGPDFGGSQSSPGLALLLGSRPSLATVSTPGLRVLFYSRLSS